MERVECGDVRRIEVLASEKRHALLVDSDHGVHLLDEAGRVTRETTIHRASFLLTDHDLVVAGERWRRTPGDEYAGWFVRDGACQLTKTAASRPFLGEGGALRAFGYNEWLTFPKVKGEGMTSTPSTDKLLHEASGVEVSPPHGFRAGFTARHTLAVEAWGEPAHEVQRPNEGDLPLSTPVALAPPLAPSPRGALPAVVGWIRGDVLEMAFPAPKGDGFIPFRVELGARERGCGLSPLKDPPPSPSRTEERSDPALFRTSDGRLWLATVERSAACRYARPPRVAFALFGHMIPTPPSWDCVFAPADDQLVLRHIDDPNEATRPSSKIAAHIPLPHPPSFHDQECTVSEPTISVAVLGTRVLFASGESVLTLETAQIVTK